MALIRSIIHMLWMAITVVPYTLAIVLGSLFGMRGTSLYRIARAWLSLCVHSARPLLGIQYRVTGMEHLPQGEKSGAVLLCKHQSTYETFLMPAIMPHPLAYVFKKELLYVPFFGWSIGRLDMIHIDRSLRAKAFNKVVQQGKALLAKGTWVIMFPEGTPHRTRPAGDLQERWHQVGDQDRCAGDSGRGDLGQMLAAQGAVQAAGPGRDLDRAADSQCRAPP